MTRLGTLSNSRLFRFDKIADSIMPLETGSLAKVCKGPDFAFIANEALLRSHPEFQVRAVANHHVAQPGGALDDYACANTARSHYLHVGPDSCVASDLDFRTDISSCRIQQGNPGFHQPMVNLLTKLSFHLRKLLT